MIGQSFAPTGANQQQRPAGGNPAVQQAIKVLNLRIPKVVGAGAIAPQPLLMSPGAGGIPSPQMPSQGMTPGGAPGGAPSMPGGQPPLGLEDILRRIFQPGGSGPAAPGPQAPTPEAPTPRIIPQNPPGGGGTAGPNPREQPTRPNPGPPTRVPRF